MGVKFFNNSIYDVLPVRLDEGWVVDLPVDVGCGAADGYAGHLDVPAGRHGERLVEGRNLGRDPWARGDGALRPT